MSLALVKDQPQDEVSFADFWLLFPKRVARMEAEKAWNRLNGVQRVDALIGLSLWRPVWLAEGRLGYVPHASTWLNQQRWTDELPTTWGTSSAGHVPAVIPSSPERSVMPDHVKALLAKMRGK
jgi:DNA replication protein DnaC